MFREPEDRRLGERPEDPAVRSLMLSIVCVTILCSGLLAAAFYLIFARHITTEGVIGVDVWTMVAVGALCYLFMVWRELRRQIAMRTPQRKRMRSAAFIPPWR